VSKVVSFVAPLDFSFIALSRPERTDIPLRAVSAMSMVDQPIRSKGREYCKALLECAGRQHQRNSTERIGKHRQQTSEGCLILSSNILERSEMFRSSFGHIGILPSTRKDEGG
jgi:hypothetical protein